MLLLVSVGSNVVVGVIGYINGTESLTTRPTTDSSRCVTRGRARSSASSTRSRSSLLLASRDSAVVDAEIAFTAAVAELDTEGIAAGAVEAAGARRFVGAADARAGGRTRGLSSPTTSARHSTRRPASNRMYRASSRRRRPRATCCTTTRCRAATIPRASTTPATAVPGRPRTASTTTICAVWRTSRATRASCSSPRRGRSSIR